MSWSLFQLQQWNVNDINVTWPIQLVNFCFKVRCFHGVVPIDSVSFGLPLWSWSIIQVSLYVSPLTEAITLIWSLVIVANESTWRALNYYIAGHKWSFPHKTIT